MKPTPKWRRTFSSTDQSSFTFLCSFFGAPLVPVSGSKPNSGGTGGWSSFDDVTLINGLARRPGALAAASALLSSPGFTELTRFADGREGSGSGGSGVRLASFPTGSSERI